MKSPMRVSFEGEGNEVVIPLHACGWGYANQGCKLHRAAVRCGVPRLSDFFAPKGTGLTPWFPVVDGLESVRGLRAELGSEPSSVCDVECSLRDLNELERILTAAPSERFRFSIVRKDEQVSWGGSVERNPPQGAANPVGLRSTDPPHETSMNSIIEIHDSTLTSVTAVGRALVISFGPAYVHQSAGRPGRDDGSGWLQDLDLVIADAVVESLPLELPAGFSDGMFSVGGRLEENVIPLPLAVSGEVLFSALTDCVERLVVRGSGASIVPRGGLRFVEEFRRSTGDGPRTAGS